MPADTSIGKAEVAEDLAKQIKAVIERIKAQPFDERLKMVQGSYLFDVEGLGTWKIDVNEGKLSVSEGAAEADCIIRCDAGYFVRLASGEQNLLTALMQGQVEVEGDMALAQKLAGILPAPKRAASRKGGSK